MPTFAAMLGDVAAPMDGHHGKRYQKKMGKTLISFVVVEEPMPSEEVLHPNGDEELIIYVQKGEIEDAMEAAHRAIKKYYGDIAGEQRKKEQRT